MLQTSIREAAPDAVHPLAGSDRTMDDQYRLRSDLELAMEVQRQMMPRNTKQLATIRYAGRSAAARGIGGDYYDFLDLGPSSLGLVLADVCGKGVAAALLMANLQASIRCESAGCVRGLHAILQRVNAHFYESTLAAQYATLFFGRYDDRTRRLNYINCGQQPVIIVRADGAVERLEATALPLGMVTNWNGEERTVEFQSGDKLFACSDGVIEAGLENGYEFGEAGLISVIATDPDQDIECAVARIAQATCALAPNGPADDMTIVGMRVL